MPQSNPDEDETDVPTSAVSQGLATRLTTLLVAGVLTLGVGFTAYSFVKQRRAEQLAGKSMVDPIATGSISAAEKKGGTGLPVPRFVSLKTDKVNVHKGPASDRPVSFTYQMKGLPVEIIAEFETWRKIRDAQGNEGWILRNMLGSKRTALIAPTRTGTQINMMYGPSVDSGAVAKLASGVLADIKSCDGTWCRLKASGYDGYVDQNLVWGAYPREVVN